MIFGGKAGKIDLDKAFGKEKANIETMNSKLRNIVSDNISMIGATLDEYFAGYHDEIANLKGGEYFVTGFRLGTKELPGGDNSIRSIDEFKLIPGDSKYGVLTFFAAGVYRVKVDFYHWLGEDASQRDIDRLVRRLEAYFSNIPNVKKVFTWGSEIIVYLNTYMAQCKFIRDMNKFLEIYFAKRKIKADIISGYGRYDVQIYGFSNDE